MNGSAVQVADRLAEVNCDDDEGDEQEGVECSHDEEADVGSSPVEGNRDQGIHGGDAGDAQCANNLRRRSLHVCDDVVNKASGHAYDADEGDQLKGADHEEGRREGSGSIARDLHDCV